LNSLPLIFSDFNLYLPKKNLKRKQEKKKNVKKTRKQKENKKKKGKNVEKNI